jgi:hypothetical protein
MEKIQNKINYCEEAEKSAADQNKSNPIVGANIKSFLFYN